MTAAKPLSPEEIAELRERHVQRGNYCGYCAYAWPCDAARLLATLDAVRDSEAEDHTNWALSLYGVQP